MALSLAALCGIDVFDVHVGFRAPARRIIHNFNEIFFQGTGPNDEIFQQTLVFLGIPQHGLHVQQIPRPQRAVPPFSTHGVLVPVVAVVAVVAVVGRVHVRRREETPHQRRRALGQYHVFSLVNFNAQGFHPLHVGEIGLPLGRDESPPHVHVVFLQPQQTTPFETQGVCGRDAQRQDGVGLRRTGGREGGGEKKKEDTETQDNEKDTDRATRKKPENKHNHC